MATHDRRILVLYTGGTLGMLPGPKGHVPAPGFLRDQLLSMPLFHDRGHPALTLPRTRSGRRARYTIEECTPLVDSSNMRPDDWVRIARRIEEAYDDHDAFVVIHGTDTMAYTASALSFMLVDLSKTVILTGSQIPLVHARNDAVDNLLGALTLATDYDIPEVGLYFRNRLLRGNRSTKVDASGFDAFDSGNAPPLATVGIGIDVAWDQVRQPATDHMGVRSITEREVAAVRLFPGMTADTLGRFLQPPLRGAVLLTYGSGNAPDDRPEFLDVLRRATDQGITVVNVTQCHKGRVSDDYATGRALQDAGVVPGADMTPEAALTKLAYLLSQDELDGASVRRLLTVDLRGELSVEAERDRVSFRERAFVAGVARSLGASSDEGVGRALWPVLLCAAARDGDLAALVRMARSGAHLEAADHDGRTALHLASAEGHTEVVAWLLSHGVPVDARDRRGHTALDEAVYGEHGAVVHLLTEHGASTGGAGLLDALRRAVDRGDVSAAAALLRDVPPED